MASCTWSVSGTDAGDFEISNVDDETFGALTFKETPNYEMPADSNGDNVYMVTVVVTDGKLTAMRDVAITITNVDEAGTVTLSSEQPKIGIPLTAALEDPDGVVADSVKWTWHLQRQWHALTLSRWLRQTPTHRRRQMRIRRPVGERRATPTEKGPDKSAVGATDDDVVVVENTANVAPKFPSSETGMQGSVAEGTGPGEEINAADR